jgi:hypothetical protein
LTTRRVTKSALLSACDATPPSTADLERALASAARAHGAATPEVLRARALITSIDGAEAALDAALATKEPLQIAAAAARCDAVGVASSPRLVRLRQLRALSPRALCSVRIQDAMQRGDVAAAAELTAEAKRVFFEGCADDAGCTRVGTLLGTGATVCTYATRAAFDLTRSPSLARWVVDIMRGAAPAQSQGERALRTLSYIEDASILSSAAPSLGALRRRAHEPWCAVENELRLSLTTAGAQLRPAPAATLALISGAMRAGANGDARATGRGQAQWLFAPAVERPSAHDVALAALLDQRAAWAELGAELGAAFCDEVFVQLMVQLTGPPSVAAARRGWALFEAVLGSRCFLPGQELENYVEWFLRRTKGRSAEEAARARHLVELLHTAQLDAAAVQLQRTPTHQGPLR